MVKIAVVTVNLGRFDKYIPWVEQDTQADIYSFNDSNFPPRDKALTPRMQTKIIKCFAWQFVPDYDIYVYVDASFALLRNDSVSWIISQLGDKDFVFFKHPERETVAEEWAFMEYKMPKSNYLMKRYTGEWEPKEGRNLQVLACGVFAYKNNLAMKIAMKEWWYYISRFHMNDQLTLPYSLLTSGSEWNVIDQDIYHSPYFTYTRTMEYLRNV